MAAVVLSFAYATALSADTELGVQVTNQPLGLPIPALALLIGSAVALYWRRRYPVAVLIVALTVVLLWELGQYPPNFDLAIFVAPYSVGRYASSNTGAATLGAFTLASFFVSAAVVGEPVGLAGLWIILWATWYGGRRVRIRGEYLALLEERAAHLEEQKQLHARRAVAKERAYFARELHDVVANRVSMMTVQAGAAKTVALTDPEGAATAMAEVERAGRTALGELRQLLDVLRPRTDPEHPSPQPSVADVPELVAQQAASGMDVALRADDVPSDVPGLVGLSTYRIVQESLTNVFKHAGPTAHTDVELRVDDDEVLTIEVTNTGSGPVGPHRVAEPGPGYGIIGMRERTSLLGGSLTAEPRRDGGFRVLARLPMATEPQLQLGST